MSQPDPPGSHQKSAAYGEALMSAEPDAVSRQMSQQQVAAERAERMRLTIRSLVSDLQAAYDAADWWHLGYASWQDYCQGEFGEHRLKLPRGERAAAAVELSDSGLSVRAIASGLGVSKSAVQADLKPAPSPPEHAENDQAVQKWTDDDQGSLPESMTEAPEQPSPANADPAEPVVEAEIVEDEPTTPSEPVRPAGRFAPRTPLQQEDERWSQHLRVASYELVKLCEKVRAAETAKHHPKTLAALRDFNFRRMETYELLMERSKEE